VAVAGLTERNRPLADRAALRCRD